jgi:signal transduction histidine kinase
VTLSEAARAQARVSPEAAMRRLEEVADAARRSLDEARRAIWALRPEALEHGSLGRALGELAAGFGFQTGIDTQSAVTGEEDELLPDAQEALLRIAQEALANVRKHSRAHRVQLTLSYLDQAILLDVCDDGSGFDPRAPARTGSGGGFGLPGMRERVAALGGTLTVESAPGQGTTVAAALPRGAAGDRHDR